MKKINPQYEAATASKPYRHYPYLTEDEVVEVLGLRKHEFRWLCDYRGLRPRKNTVEGELDYPEVLYWAGDLTPDKLGFRPSDAELAFDVSAERITGESRHFKCMPFTADGATIARIMRGRQDFILRRAAGKEYKKSEGTVGFQRFLHQYLGRGARTPDVPKGSTLGWLREPRFRTAFSGYLYRSMTDDLGFWKTIEDIEGCDIVWEPAEKQPIEESRLLVLFDEPILFEPNALMEREDDTVLTDKLKPKFYAGTLADFFHERWGDDIPQCAWSCPFKVVKTNFSNWDKIMLDNSPLS